MERTQSVIIIFNFSLFFERIIYDANDLSQKRVVDLP